MAPTRLEQGRAAKNTPGGAVSRVSQGNRVLSPVLPIEDQDDGNTRESGVIQNAGDPGRCSFRFRKTDGNLLDRPPKAMVITKKHPGNQASESTYRGSFGVDPNHLPSPTLNSSSVTQCPAFCSWTESLS